MCGAKASRAVRVFRLVLAQRQDRLPTYASAPKLERLSREGVLQFNGTPHADAGAGRLLLRKAASARDAHIDQRAYSRAV
jgi:hypothetical protein